MEATSQLNVALIGAGGGQAKAHYIPALAWDDRVRIAALVDPNQAGIHRALRREPAFMLSQPPMFRDIGEMFTSIDRGDAPRVDAAFVLTHGAGRDDLITTLLDGGVKFVMTEKPMAVGIAAARRIEAAARRTGGLVAINHQYLNWTRRFRPWFDAELTGRLTYARARWIRVWERRLGPYAEPAHGGLVYDLGGHVLAPALDIDNWPNIVAARPIDLPPNERRVHVHANLITERGAVIEVRLSDELATRKGGTSIFARRGHEFEMDFRLPTREIVTSPFRVTVSRSEHGMPLAGRIPVDPPTTAQMVRHNVEACISVARGEEEIERTGLTTLGQGMVLTRALALLSAAHERNENVTWDDLERE